MSDAIINQVVCLMARDVNDVLFLKTEFTINSEKVDGKILIFTDSASLTKMLDAINKLAGSRYLYFNFNIIYLILNSTSFEYYLTIFDLNCFISA